MKTPTHKRKFSFWRVIVALSTVGVAALIFIPSYGSHCGVSRRSSCQSNLKQIMLGVKQYIQDYDEKYPLVVSAPKVDKKNGFSAFGWADGIQPYLKSTQLYQCPSESNPPAANPMQRHYTDYWFNARLSGKRDEQVEAASQMISLGDGNDGADATNARYHLLSIPPEWRKDETSPLGRHSLAPNIGANYAFVDGHVKWFAADKWKNELDMHNGLTLRLKPTN